MVRPLDPHVTPPQPLLALTGSGHASIGEVFAARVAASPDRVFIRSGDQTWTFTEAWQLGEAYAARYAAAGLTASDRVVSYIQNRPEALWSWLGTHLLGSVHVWINRQHKGDVLADLLRRSHAAVLITEESARDALPPAGRACVRLAVNVDGGEFADLGYEELPAAGLPPPGPLRARSGDPAIILFTSGTTGRSKAVLVPHNQLCRGSARMCEYACINAPDVIQAWLPMYHIGGVDATLMAMITGCTLDLLPTFSASRFWHDVERARATICFLFPAVADILLSRPPSPRDTLNSLRIGVATGLSADAISQFEQRFGLRMLTDYGMTEAQPIAYTPLADPCPAGSCGKPNPDFHIAILDDADQPQSNGKPGQIAIRPATRDVMMLGYEGDEAATVYAWRNLWFHTGDLGYIDASGYLYFIDRQKDAIRRRGENISSWEIEAILTAHPVIAGAAVVAVPSPLGEDDVKAAVVLTGPSALQPADVHAYCLTRMARFMVPRYIEIRSELPMTQTGKVRKESLRIITGNEWDSERQFY